MIDLSQHTLADLRKLQEQIKEEMKSREAQEIQKAREQILAIAQGVGRSVQDLLASSGKTAKKTGTVAVRFQHPENQSQKWTGRGRQPKWVKEWIEGGQPIEKLRVS
jgi:DNA-binding protein H-NS